MSVSDLMEAMAAAGAPMEAIILAVRALEAKDAEVAKQATLIEERRANDRDRKRRQRAKDTGGTVTGRSRDTDGTVTDEPLSRPPNEINSNPPTHTPEIKPRARKAENFVLPQHIPAEPWDGWLAMRRRMGKAPTDYAKSLAVVELDKLAADGWPPGEVLNHCTMNSYQGIFPPKDRANGNDRKTGANGNQRGDGFSRALREVADREAADPFAGQH